MLKIVEFDLELPPNEKINSSMGSLMHGALMEMISAQNAYNLHKEGLRPFSQCLYFNHAKNKAVWRVSTLNAATYELITVHLFNKPQIFLRQKGYDISLRNFQIILDSSYEKLADEIFPNSNKPHGADISFLTTTSFKRDGEYIIFPETFLIFQSLLNKWNSFSEKLKLEENNLPEKLSSFCKISGYKLQTTNFSLEGKKIVGFKGNTRLLFVGNEVINRLLALLTHFAPFSGIGIKTALGMGAVNLEKFF